MFQSTLRHHPKIYISLPRDWIAPFPRVVCVTQFSIYVSSCFQFPVCLSCWGFTVFVFYITLRKLLPYSFSISDEWRVPLVEQNLLTHPVCTPALRWPSFKWCSSFPFFVAFWGTIVCLFLLWPLYYMSFDLRLVITPLVS